MTESSKIINDIENALKVCEYDFSHQELIEILKGDDDVKKQICILKIETLESQEEADLLIFHLTEHHGIVRESTAQKLNELITNGKYKKLFQNNNAYDTFLKSINDVNPNICRVIIEALPEIFKNNNDGLNYFLNKLYDRFDFVFDELEKLKRSNWYTKKLFNLYWCLEMLAMINAPVDEKMLSTLKKTCAFKEYTIREKSAMVLAFCDNKARESSPQIQKDWEELKESLKDDPNFYVRRYSDKF